jgi:hypothetical protein
MTYDYLIVHQTQFFGEKVVWLADFEQAKKMQELDLTDFYRFAERMRNGLMERGIELPPIPPEDEVRQILIRMAESGNLIKMSEPVDIHKAIKDDGNGNN